MKKIKLLTPMLGVCALGTAIAPVLTSCSSSSETTIVPKNMFNMDGNTCKGLVLGANVSQYDTLEIPEGTKFISEGAFAIDREDVMLNSLGMKQTEKTSRTPFTYGFKTGDTNGTIRTVKFPTTLREIEAAGFYYCDSIRVLDFSEWDAEEIHYLTIGQNAFDGFVPYGKVIFKEGITETSKNALKTKLMNAGLQPMWFMDETQGRVSVDASWKAQETTNGEATIQVTLNKDIEENQHLYAVVTKVGGTTGVDLNNYGDLHLESNGFTKETAYDVTFNKETSKTVGKFNIELLNHLANNDYVDYKINFIMVNGELGAQDVAWIQTIDGMKLTFKQQTIEIEHGAAWDYVANSGKTWTIDTKPLTFTDNIKKEDAIALYFDQIASNPRILIDELYAQFNANYEEFLEVVRSELGDKNFQFNTYKINIGDIAVNKEKQTINCKVIYDYKFTYNWTDSQNNSIPYIVQCSRAVELKNMPLLFDDDDGKIIAIYANPVTGAAANDWSIKATSSVLSQLDTIPVEEGEDIDLLPSYAESVECNKYSSDREYLDLVTKYLWGFKLPITTNNAESLTINSVFRPSMFFIEPILLKDAELTSNK